MNRSLSIFLDFLRFMAALVVVAGHFSQGYFSSGWPDGMPGAVNAVAVFFVLSGFVIAYVTQVKEKTVEEYAIARISRLYSVLVPAVVLSGVVLWLGFRLDSAYISQWTSAGSDLSELRAHPVWRFLCQSVLSLTFTNSLHDHEGYPGINSPVWSLGYEAPYYAAFAIMLFCRGARRWGLLILAALIGGAGIVRLFPVWLAGVWMYRWSVRLQGYAKKRWVGVLCGVALVAGVVAWPMFLQWMRAAHSPLVVFLLSGNGRAINAAAYYFWGALTCVAILFVSAFAAEMEPVWVGGEKPIRWLAGRTFSVYLFHYPLLALAYLLFHYDRGSRVQSVSALAGVLAACFALSLISEDKKRWWRGLVRKGFVRMHEVPGIRRILWERGVVGAER